MNAANATPNAATDTTADRVLDAGRLAAAVRMLAVDMVNAANSGHPGLPLGAADVATSLFASHLVFDAAHPRWPNRDRFVLSAGHGSALLYALGYLVGADGVTLDDLRRFRQLGSPCAGHPEYGHFPIAETTTGPLGQGIANAVGMAIAEERLRAEFGPELCDHHTWVLAGDGCLMEGITAEAIALAGHLRLNRLVVLWDDNRITIDGPTSRTTIEDQPRRFEAAGWSVIEVDGHDPAEIDAALGWARQSERPSLVACRTTIGHGAPTKAGTHAVHGAPLGPDERAAMAETLDWPTEPFVVPDDVLAEWRAIGRRGAERYAHWVDALSAHPLAAAFERRMVDPTPPRVGELDNLRDELVRDAPTIATRSVNVMVLDRITSDPPNDTLLGGSADLAGSNGLAYAGAELFTADDRTGNTIAFGIREHAMAAALNGIALHGGFRPYGGTFLTFSDYSRPAIRLAALMGLGVIHVFTHDSIGVGEDGPTHQPVEHLCALRSIPGLVVIRPADAVETVEAWRLALASNDRPTVLALSRQALPTLDRAAMPTTDAHGVSAGAYVLVEVDSADVTILASGSEVSIAVDAARLLTDDGIAARVVSMASMELFAARPAADQAEVLGAAPRIAVEASIGQSWHAWLRPGDVFIGMTGFGASAPADELYQHFGINADAVVAAATTAVAAARPDQPDPQPAPKYDES